MGGFEPVQGGAGLGVGVGGVFLEVVDELILHEVVSVQVRAKGNVGEVRLGGDDERGVATFEVGAGGEKVENLGRAEVHEGVVEEKLGRGREGYGSFRVTMFVFGGEVVVQEFFKTRAAGLEFPKLRGLHEHDGGG